MSASALIIGIDFDNTIACYDHLFMKAAADIAGLSQTEGKTKKEIRDQVRNLSHGEKKWQMMQAEVYGPQMSSADLYPGVSDFLEACYHHRVSICIVSHKTEYAKMDIGNVNLRTEALKWMESKRVITHSGPGVQKDWVYFEDTRVQKISRIKELGCTHFIDDLVDVLEDPDFPSRAKRIHFGAGGPPLTGRSFQSFKTWRDILNAIFHD